MSYDDDKIKSRLHDHLADTVQQLRSLREAGCGPDTIPKW